MKSAKILPTYVVALLYGSRKKHELGWEADMSALHGMSRSWKLWKMRLWQGISWSSEWLFDLVRISRSIAIFALNRVLSAHISIRKSHTLSLLAIFCVLFVANRTFVPCCAVLLSLLVASRHMTLIQTIFFKFRACYIGASICITWNQRSVYLSDLKQLKLPKRLSEATSRSRTSLNQRGATV